jgi:formate dehydrogenase subunit gamma
MNDTTSNGHPRVIGRYTANERTNHWIVAISFVLTALSGLAMFHPALFWLSALVGGGTWTRILHPFLGLLMILSFSVLAATMWKHNKMEPRDWQWMRQSRDVLNNREEHIDNVGRYNGGQKLMFAALVICAIVLLVSGIILWREYFSGLFSIGTIRFAAVLHGLFAFVLVCAIVVHIYAAWWVKGSISAMTRGTVTPGWAWKHHRAWFREKIHATNSRSRPD